MINGPLQGNNDKQSRNGYPPVTVNETMVDRMEELLTNQYNHDFNERAFKDQEEMSGDESNALFSFKKGTIKLNCISEKKNVLIQNDLCVAKQCIHGLRKKLHKDVTLCWSTHKLFQGKERNELCLTVEQISKESYLTVNFCKAQT